MNKPNIVFVVCDDLGVNDLRCYGRADHVTPNLDRLAAQGTRFTSAYASQAICSASRAGLLTGLNPARLHMTTFLPGRRNAAPQRVLHPEIAMNPLSRFIFLACKPATPYHFILVQARRIGTARRMAWARRRSRTSRSAWA